MSIPFFILSFYSNPLFIGAINERAMRRTILLLILSFCCHFIIGQTFQDCISIDFERILDTPSTEGLVVSDQFQDTFGVSFSLETGGFPVLADVGGFQTGFGSNYGPDTPAPGQGIGAFFLTDDGVLEGLDAPPIILDFSAPVDSFSGCILDMDFGEIFIIQAKDINDEIILIDTIFSTDPGTGDGLSTCWGFNLEGCEGSVYSIRFEGQRTIDGAFGMGIDNLVFCQSGIDIANEVTFESTPAGCDGSLGAITVINQSNTNFIYSIDGIIFQESPVFDNLESGFYSIIVQDEDGCAADIDNLLVQGEFFNSFTEVIASDARCGADNGFVQVLVNQEEGITFSLDGEFYQSSPVFDNLEPGSYTIYFLDSSGCESQQPILIGNEDLVISDVLATDTKCNEINGRIEIIPSNASGVLYSIDGINFQESPIFTDLPAGDYIVQLTDDGACLDVQPATILPSEEVTVAADVNADWCNDSNGTIFLQASGGSGSYLYSINNDSFQLISTYSGLSSDTYLANVVDEDGCTAEVELRVDSGEPIIINKLDAMGPDCENLFGSIDIVAEGGNGLISYSLNGDILSSNPYFNNLDVGDYSILVVDDKGCQDSLQARFEFPACPIYIPNVFSPQADGTNDLFQVFTNGVYDVEVLEFSIFDRWGNHLWQGGDFTLHTAELSDWWDGTFRSKECNTGVYVYMIRVRHRNGLEELYSGDLTLLQ